MGRRDRPALTPRLVLDTGALIALERGDPRAFEHLATAARRGFLVVAPVLAVMQALAGARDPAWLSHILGKLDAELPLTASTVRQVRGLGERAGVTDPTDVVVVLEALAIPGSMILTSDPDDMLSLLAAANASGRVPVLRA